MPVWTFWMTWTYRNSSSKKYFTTLFVSVWRLPVFETPLLFSNVCAVLWFWQMRNFFETLWKLEEEEEEANTRQAQSDMSQWQLGIMLKVFVILETTSYFWHTVVIEWSVSVTSKKWSSFVITLWWHVYYVACFVHCISYCKSKTWTSGILMNATLLHIPNSRSEGVKINTYMYLSLKFSVSYVCKINIYIYIYLNLFIF